MNNLARLMLNRNSMVRAAWVGGLVALLQIVLDVMHHQLTPALLTLRLVIVVGIGVVATIFRVTPEPSLGVVRVVIAALGAFATLAITALSGGANSPYQDFTFVVPLLVALVMQGDRRAVVTAGVIVMTGEVIVGALEPAGGEDPLIHLFNAAVATLAALIGSALVVRVGAMEKAAAERKARLAMLEIEAQSARDRAKAAEELAASEARRAHSERLALLGQLAAGVGHEIKNPLAYIRANIDFVAEELASAPPDLKDALADTQRGIDQVLTIVGDLKGFARNEHSGPPSCDVTSATAEALRIARFRTAGRVSIDRTGVMDEAFAAIDRGRLVQVLVNLIVNSADAFEGAERSGAPIRGAKVTVNVESSDSELVVNVRDNGPGIPSSVMARLFQPFVTTKPAGEGLGLGLPLCREYIEAAGGKITAASTEGQGACFTIRLPMTAMPVRARAA